jgi:hypothetical protein
MKKAVVVFFGVAVLAGCGSNQDANEKNFGKAISQYLDKKGELCLRLNRWPVDVSGMDLDLQKSLPTGTARRMEALAAVGLATETDVEMDQIGPFDNKPTGLKYKIKRYVLTDAGKKFYREKEVNKRSIGGTKKAMEGDICYGKEALDKIVKWEGPMKLGDYQEANVFYLYKIDGVAAWTKNPEFLAAFPEVGQVIEAAGKEKQSHPVELTSIGWEARGLDR